MKELIVRGISGLVFLALVFVPIFSDYADGNNTFALTLCGFAVVGSYELVRMSGKKQSTQIVAAIISMCLFLPLLVNIFERMDGHPARFSFESLVYMLLALWTLFLLIFLVLIFQQDKAKIILDLGLFSSVFYPTLPFLLLAMALEASPAEYRLYLFFILLPVYINDTFAYITGRLLGKRKMFPVVSPKKTWEGFIGGVAGAQIIMHIIVYSVMDSYNGKTALIVTIFSLAASVLATFGDLFESKLKRTAGVKDSGKIIPGHGGVLDRVDAMLFVAPLLYVLLQLILKF